MRGNEIDRARHAAIKAYQAHINDKQRSGIKVIAVEVRLGFASPDISLHIASGSQTQGGYLFFTEDLQADATRPTTVL